MDDQDRRLINSIQAEFPLVERPYEALGRKLRLSEEEVLERIRHLREDRVIREISAIFDTRALGYQSSLVAMKVIPQDLDGAGAIISRHPGVSHNYARDHEFNLWFTIAVPPSHDLRGTVDRLHELASAEFTRFLPSLKVFKIGVQLDMSEKKPIGHRRNAGCRHQGELISAVGGSLPSAGDIPVIRELQRDLPLQSRPFDSMAERIGMPVGEFLKKAEQFKETGRMRRFAAVLAHRRAGFGANAMGVWRVDPGEVDQVGPVMASFDAVTHCYQRPTYPDWPYSLFTMVHGRSREECEAILSAISGATGVREYRVLYSTREYKKARIRYFSEEFDEWRSRYMGDA